MANTPDRGIRRGRSESGKPCPAWALDPWLHLAALAVTSERISLGVNVCCALYRHPVMTARLAVDLDNLSNGRLILGLGNGWDANEFANLGLPFRPARDRQAALAEALEIIRGVWGEQPFSFEGSTSAVREHTYHLYRSSVRVHRS